MDTCEKQVTRHYRKYRWCESSAERESCYAMIAWYFSEDGQLATVMIHSFDVKRQMAVLLAVHGDSASLTNRKLTRSNRVSNATKDARRTVAYELIDILRDRGMRLASLKNLKQKHVFAAIESWNQRNLSVGTLLGKISCLQFVCNILGKYRLLKGYEQLLPEEKRHRTLVATRDKSWAGNGVDFEDVIRRVRAIEPWVADTLRLCQVFALRIEEARRFRPHESDLGGAVYIRRGAKGGRARIVEEWNDEQRALIDELKQRIPPGRSLIPIELTAKQAENRFAYVVRKVGVTKKGLGVTAHGLRHEALQGLYEQRTGMRAPSAGGTVRPASDNEARQAVAQAAGHNRPQVSGAYLGQVLRARPVRVQRE